MSSYISTQVLSGNLFGSWDAAADGVNEKASVERYAEQFREALAAEYPEAHITVSVQHNCEGCVSQSASDDIDLRDVDEIGFRIFEAQNWTVNA